MYQILIKRSAEKELSRLPSNVVRKISQVIDSLAFNPRPEGIKKLVGQREILWRIRVGDYRIVYQIQDTHKILEIRRVGHRKDIYS